jgi:hypothetical protein
MTVMRGHEKRYLSCAETAKLIRTALKKNFPGIKFSVRSNTYAGGASIDVGWTDGPTGKEVDAVVKLFEGGRFDGMIDMAFYVSHWLLPDGTVEIAHSPGSTGSMGVMPPIENIKPHDDAELVHFGADYVFTNRRVTAPTYEAALRTVCKKWGVEPVPPVVTVGRYASGKEYPTDPHIAREHDCQPGGGHLWLSDLVRRELAGNSF